jgi:hypothetical protein
VSLDRIWLDCNDFDQCVESDISDIVVAVRQKLSENVNTEHAQARISFNVEDSKHGLIENGVTNVIRGIGVGSDLRMSAAALFIATLVVPVLEYR